MTSGEPPQAHPLYLELGDVLDLYGQVFQCRSDEAADQTPRSRRIGGYKRTALAAMRTFLLINGFDVSASQINGFDVSASQVQRADRMIGLSRDLTVVGLAAELRESLVPKAHSGPNG